jgi:hypothetical protein
MLTIAIEIIHAVNIYAAILVYTYMFKMLAPPPRQTFDDLKKMNFQSRHLERNIWLD